MDFTPIDDTSPNKSTLTPPLMFGAIQSISAVEVEVSIKQVEVNDESCKSPTEDRSMCYEVVDSHYGSYTLQSAYHCAEIHLSSPNLLLSHWRLATANSRHLMPQLDLDMGVHHSWAAISKYSANRVDSGNMTFR